MSFLFVEFNFCPEKQESQIVKITPSWLSRVDTRIELSRSLFLKKTKTSFSVLQTGLSAVLRLRYIASVDTVLLLARMSLPLAQKRTDINTANQNI